MSREEGHSLRRKNAESGPKTTAIIHGIGEIGNTGFGMDNVGGSLPGSTPPLVLRATPVPAGGGFFGIRGIDQHKSLEFRSSDMEASRRDSSAAGVEKTLDGIGRQAEPRC